MVDASKNLYNHQEFVSVSHLRSGLDFKGEVIGGLDLIQHGHVLFGARRNGVILVDKHVFPSPLHVSQIASVQWCTG